MEPTTPPRDATAIQAGGKDISVILVKKSLIKAKPTKIKSIGESEAPRHLIVEVQLTLNGKTGDFRLGSNHFGSGDKIPPKLAELKELIFVHDNSKINILGGDLNFNPGEVKLAKELEQQANNKKIVRVTLDDTTKVGSGRSLVVHCRTDPQTAGKILIHTTISGTISPHLRLVYTRSC